MFDLSVQLQSGSLLCRDIPHDGKNSAMGQGAEPKLHVAAGNGTQARRELNHQRSRTAFASRIANGIANAKGIRRFKQLAETQPVNLIGWQAAYGRSRRPYRANAPQLIQNEDCVGYCLENGMHEPFAAAG